MENEPEASSQSLEPVERLAALRAEVGGSEAGPAVDLDTAIRLVSTAERRALERASELARHAEQLVVEAEVEVESVLTDARTEAAGMVADAEAKVDPLLDEAQAQADLVVADACRQADEVARQAEVEAAKVRDAAQADAAAARADADSARARTAAHVKALDAMSAKARRALDEVNGLRSELAALVDDPGPGADPPGTRPASEAGHDSGEARGPADGGGSTYPTASAPVAGTAGDPPPPSTSGATGPVAQRATANAERGIGLAVGAAGPSHSTPMAVGA